MPPSFVTHVRESNGAQVVSVRASGSSLSAGQIGKITDSTSGYVTCVLADSTDTGADEEDYVYILENISAGTNGDGIIKGTITGVDTSTYTAPYVWLNASGTLSNTPSGGLVQLGKVNEAAGDGTIWFDGNPPNLKETVHPKFWGAVCDGTTQDRVAWKAMNAWLDANNGGVVELEETDVINLDGDIYVGQFPGPNYGSNITVNGNGATLLKTMHYNGSTITNISGGGLQKRGFWEFGQAGASGTTPTASNIRIFDMKFLFRFTSVDGNWYTYLQGLGSTNVVDYISCLMFFLCDDVQISRCSFRFEAPDLMSRLTQHAVLAYGLSNCVMDKCYQFQTQAKLGSTSSGYGYRNITYRDNYAEFPCNGQFSLVGFDPDDSFEGITIVDNHQYGLNGEFQILFGSDGGAHEIGQIRNVTIRGNKLDGPWIVRNPDTSIPNPGLAWGRYQILFFPGDDCSNVDISDNHCYKESEETTAGLTTPGEGQLVYSNLDTLIPDVNNSLSNSDDLIIQGNTMGGATGQIINGWQIQLFGKGTNVQIKNNSQSKGRGYRIGAQGGAWTNMQLSGNQIITSEYAIRITAGDSNGVGVRGTFVRSDVTGNTIAITNTKAVLWLENILSTDGVDMAIHHNKLITTGIPYLSRLMEISGNVVPSGIYARNNSMDGGAGYNDNFETLTANRTLTTQDNGKTFKVDTTSGLVTIQCQDNTGGNIGVLHKGLSFKVVRVAGANNVEVRGGQATVRNINGSGSNYVISTSYAPVTFTYDFAASEWFAE